MKPIWLKSLKSNQIALNKNIVKKLPRSKRAILHFGTLSLKLNILINNNLTEDIIGLPTNLNSQYTIPKDIPYEGYLLNGEFYIGPVIAYVAIGKFEELKKQKYIKSLPIFLDYELINGLIIICTPNSIDVKEGSIEGYYYSPKANSPEKLWKYGKFPLPNAMFNRSFMSQDKISAIQNKIGNRVFNSYLKNLDKWRAWSFLRMSDIKDYLPYTSQYTNIKQLVDLIDKYNSVYLKPSKKARGIGQMKLDKNNTGISITDYKGEKFFFETHESLSKFLSSKLTIPYIVQQAVHYKANNRHLDFRVILQKNQQMEWSLTGLVARIAQEGSIITNKRGRETSMIGRNALTTFFNLSEAEAERIEEEMTQLVKRVVNLYEEKGILLGDVAADITLDSNLKIWLLELQLNYGVNARNTEGLNDFFKKVVSTPFKYAKSLAGFVNK